MAGFNYLIASTNTVQDLLRKSEWKAQQKIEKKVEEYRIVGVEKLKKSGRNSSRQSYEEKQAEFEMNAQQYRNKKDVIIEDRRSSVSDSNKEVLRGL